jgi:hypothetical protein
MDPSAFPGRIRRHYGGAATGDYYWPRPDFTEPLIDALSAGESVSLFGLRRTGKSSVLLEVDRLLKAVGRKPVYVDVQGRDRIDPIVGALIAALPAAGAGSKMTNVLAAPRLNKAIELWHRLKGRESPGPPSPREVLHQVELMKGDFCAILARQERSIVLMIDELPFLITNMLDSGIKAAEVNAFLAILRSWRHEGKVPMLLSGSMGLQWLVRERGIARENFNDLVPYTTPPPLTDDDARAMLRALAAGEDCAWIDDTILDVILAETAARYPSFLQFAFGRVKGHNARSPDAVRRVFADHIRPSLDEDFYDQFDTRMARYGAEAKAAARAVLRCLDRGNGAPVALSDVDRVLAGADADARDHLLVSLVEDGFIRIDTKLATVAFSSPLVETWWQAKPYRR